VLSYVKRHDSLDAVLFAMEELSWAVLVQAKRHARLILRLD